MMYSPLLLSPLPPRGPMLLFIGFLLMMSLKVTESQFLVKSLPGFSGDLPFTLETGYIEVGESELFYYFVESEGNPKDDPLIFWLTGGPGCSGFSGLLYEIGSLKINYATSTLEKPVFEINPHSWTKVANIIFIDQPAGTGFSYAKTPEAYNTNDTLLAIQDYIFLKKWLLDHPKFLNNTLYVGGDSYMGIILPMIVEKIYNGNEVGEEPHMKIKGYLLGNPLTHTSVDYNSKIPFAHRKALLSDAIYKRVKESCNEDYLNIDPNNSLCIHDLQVVDKCLERIDIANILEPYSDASNILRSLGKQWCREDTYLYVYGWANRKDVREALHIREEFSDIEWVRCNRSFSFDFFKKAKSYTHDVFSSVGYHLRLTGKHCRALVYSGDLDNVVPYLGTMNWIESLNLSVIDDWRPWFVEEQVAGYTMKYSNDSYDLTFATIKGGGHTAPEYKPKEAFNMLMRWLVNEYL